MCILLLAVTCSLFSSNGMYAVIIIFITIVLHVCFLLLLTLSRSLFYILQCQKKPHDINTQAKMIFESINC